MKISEMSSSDAVAVWKALHETLESDEGSEPRPMRGTQKLAYLALTRLLCTRASLETMRSDDESGKLIDKAVGGGFWADKDLLESAARIIFKVSVLCRGSSQELARQIIGGLEGGGWLISRKPNDDQIKDLNAILDAWDSIEKTVFDPHLIPHFMQYTVTAIMLASMHRDPSTP